MPQQSYPMAHPAQSHAGWAGAGRPQANPWPGRLAFVLCLIAPLGVFGVWAVTLELRVAAIEARHAERMLAIEQRLSEAALSLQRAGAALESLSQQVEAASRRGRAEAAAPGPGAGTTAGPAPETTGPR